MKTAKATKNFKIDKHIIELAASKMRIELLKLDLPLRMSRETDAEPLEWTDGFWIPIAT
jgi:hypothetical protein